MNILNQTLIIPTYRRHNDLPRLFSSLLKQKEKPDEIIVVIGPGDFESLEVATEWSKILAEVKIYRATKASVIHSLNLGFSQASHEIISLLDDDVELPEDWAVKIKTRFREQRNMGAYGGRDHLQNNFPEFANPELAKEVGVFKLSGHKGNHHCGAITSPVKVHVIKGVNLSFRREAFKRMQIDPELEWQGAETCWEMDICLQIIQAGYYNLYDNSNYVFHFWSPRLGFDNRMDIFSPAWPKRIYNEIFILARYRPIAELLIGAIKLFSVGTHVQPGLIWSILLLPKKGVKVLVLPFRNAGHMWKGAVSGFKRRNENKGIVVKHEIKQAQQ
jgi:glycosyltransferase involved in cell wall biosynthesis